MNYNHDHRISELEFRVSDLEEKLERAVKAVKALADDPGQPHAGAEIARFELGA